MENADKADRNDTTSDEFQNSGTHRQQAVAHSLQGIPEYKEDAEQNVKQGIDA